MRRMLLAVGILGGVLSPAMATGATAAATPVPLDIAIVAGQSNAIGLQSYVIDQTTHVDVLQQTASQADTAVRLMWLETGVHTSGTVPVTLDTLQRKPGEPSPIFGPEIGLGRELYALGDEHLLIVKVAYGGTSLAVNWAPKSPDYAALLRRVHQAITWAKANGYAPQIVGFFWVQGEGDAINASYASSYHKHLESFIADVRANLSMPSTTPFVLAQTDVTDYIDWEQAHHKCKTSTCAPQRTWNAEVMTAQADAASSSVFVVPTSSLPRVNHYLHLSNEAELTLGTEMAEAAMGQPTGTATKTPQAAS